MGIRDWAVYVAGCIIQLVNENMELSHQLWVIYRQGGEGAPPWYTCRCIFWCFLLRLICLSSRRWPYYQYLTWPTVDPRLLDCTIFQATFILPFILSTEYCSICMAYLYSVLINCSYTWITSNRWHVSRSHDVPPPGSNPALLGQ